MKTNAFCRYLHTEMLVHFTVIVLKGSTEFPKRLRLFESVHGQVREIVTQKLTVTEKSKKQLPFDRMYMNTCIGRQSVMDWDKGKGSYITKRTLV